MKRCFLLFSMLVALCALAYADQEVVNLGATETKEGITMPMSTEEIQAEIDVLSAQIMAAKVAGLEPDAVSLGRLAELEGMIYEPVSPSSRLDQGGETCASAYEITALPFCDSGVMGATDDCNPTMSPYRDIFYKYTCTTAGTYRVSLCGSVGDTYLKVWVTTCCSGTALGTGDDECGGLDAAKDFSLTAGLTYYFEIGYYSSSQVADAYNFNLFGPEPTGVPANDLCTGAIPLAAPSTTLGTCRNATDDTGLPTCATYSTYYKGVWYTVVGNGHNLTVKTTNNCSSMNTFIRVLTATSCSGPFTCVGGNDNFGTTSGLSEYMWCTDVGVTYYIIVTCASSTAGYVGPFTLQILDGPACACDQLPLCGTPTETEPNNICPTQVDPFHIDCAETVYGLHCPEADSDFFAVTVPPMTIMTLNQYDGQNCTVNPTTSIQSQLHDANCVLLSTTTTTSGWRLTNPLAVPWNIYIKVYATTTTSRMPYKLVATCCPLVDYCVNPIVLPPVYSYTNTANTCCATNPIPCVKQTMCTGTCYTSGPDVVYKFTLMTAGILNITASSVYDNQLLVFTNCADPESTYCVASADITFTGTPETLTNLSLPAGIYYVSTSVFSTGCGDMTLSITSDVPLGYVEDLGDLGPPYPTAPHPAGPCHIVSNIAWLGPAITGEAVPNTVDLDPADDGVVFNGPIPWLACTPVSVTVTVSGNFTEPVFLSGWKDGNLDGDFDDILCTDAPTPAPEWIIQDVPIPAPGVYTFTFVDPGLPTPTPYVGIFRFRLSQFQGGPQWWMGGHSSIGEVEDYYIQDLQLPVELTTFEAIAGDREVTLRWTTATEQENAQFDVQRKTSSSAWMTVGTVEGAGNSSTTRNYEYTDRAVVNDVTYTYRLQSRDINGTIHEYEMMAEATPGAPVPTEYALEQNHPNPFNPNTSISYSVKEAGFVTLKVYNLIGQEVATLVSAKMEAGRYTVAFAANDLPSGVYVYRLEVNDFTAQKKMVLLK